MAKSGCVARSVVGWKLGKFRRLPIIRSSSAASVLSKATAAAAAALIIMMIVMIEPLDERPEHEIQISHTKSTSGEHNSRLATESKSGSLISAASRQTVCGSSSTKGTRQKVQIWPFYSGSRFCKRAQQFRSNLLNEANHHRRTYGQTDGRTDERKIRSLCQWICAAVVALNAVSHHHHHAANLHPRR